MSLSIPGVFVKPLSQIGNFFTMMGVSFKSFRQDELVDLSDDLVRNVKRHAPMNTGLLKSRITGTARKDLIEVRTAVHYAVWVELGIFGKDKTRFIATPEYGGTIFVRSPVGAKEMMSHIQKNFGDNLEAGQFEVIERYIMTETARRIRNGWAQYMRAGLYDTIPQIITHFRYVLSNKFISAFLKTDSTPMKMTGKMVTTVV